MPVYASFGRELVRRKVMELEVCLSWKALNALRKVLRDLVLEPIAMELLKRGAVRVTVELVSAGQRISKADMVRGRPARKKLVVYAYYPY